MAPQSDEKASPLSIDGKIPLLALGGCMCVALSMFFSLQSRVDLLDMKAKSAEAAMFEQRSDGKALLQAMTSVKETMGAVGGRLEKIEYRLS